MDAHFVIQHKVHFHLENCNCSDAFKSILNKFTYLFSHHCQKSIYINREIVFEIQSNSHINKIVKYVPHNVLNICFKIFCAKKNQV